MSDGDILTVSRVDDLIKSDGMWNVVMHNDDTTSMDAVVIILVTVFQKDAKDAVELMLTVHLHGKAVIDTLPKKLAKARQSEAMKLAKNLGYPEFTITVEES